MIRRWRLRRVQRRINRALEDVGWPTNPAIFTGKVKVKETRYAPGTHFVIERFGEGEWPK